MMIKLDSMNNMIYPIIAMLIGAVAFTASYILFNVLTENYFIGGLLLPAAAGTLLLGLILRLPIKKTRAMVILITCIYPIFYLIAFAIGEFSGALLGESGGSLVTNAVLAGECVILGIILGRVLYGGKCMITFTCVFSLLFLIVFLLTQSSAFMNWQSNLLSIFGQWQHVYPEEGTITYNKINTDFLPIFMGIGTALGLSVGLCNLKFNKGK